MHTNINMIVSLLWIAQAMACGFGIRYTLERASFPLPIKCVAILSVVTVTIFAVYLTSLMIRLPT